MGEMSPTFGIPYPCVGETVNPATFAAFANAVDAAVATVDAVENLALKRPTAAVAGSASIPVGVATTVTFTTELWDNAAMADVILANDRLTITRNGVFLVWGQAPTGTGANATSMALIVTRNAVAFAENKRNASGNPFNQQVVAPVPCVAGDVLRLQCLWTGLAGPLVANFQFAARLLCTT